MAQPRPRCGTGNSLLCFRNARLRALHLTSCTHPFARAPPSAQRAQHSWPAHPHAAAGVHAVPSICLVSILRYPAYALPPSRSLP